MEHLKSLRECNLIKIIVSHIFWFIAFILPSFKFNDEVNIFPQSGNTYS